VRVHVSAHRRSIDGRDRRGTPARRRTAIPFVSYDFLNALEESGCAAERTGWAPHHLSVEDEAGQVAAVMPLYLKSHSQGEYVFDHSWADAYERAGGRYYPKLQCSAPFSPVTGPAADRAAGCRRRRRPLGPARRGADPVRAAERLVAARDLPDRRRMGMDG
jgi:predicted N-acyltransferase